MLTPEENELLCRIGPKTPMGNMLRRYWVPAFLSNEVEAGGDPKRVRLFGEDLVIFRDEQGNLGLLDEACPHRGASLALGRNAGGALECLYHGWRVNCSGAILDMPAEVDEFGFKNRVRATAYSTYEAGGLIWAYMGPPESKPPPMDFLFTKVSAEQRIIFNVRTECNWVQAVEGVIDSSHTNVLHANVAKSSGDVATTVLRDDGTSARPSRDKKPRMEVENTPYGFRYAALRKPIVNDHLLTYARVTLFIAPFYAMFPPPQGWVWMQIFVPIDDYATMFYFIQVREAGISDDVRARATRNFGLQPSIDFDENREKIRRRENNWLQDRPAMRRGESFTGFPGVNMEDVIIQESMGRLYDRSKEHLGTSDVAIIRMRRLMLDAVRRYSEMGEAPPGLAEPIAYGELKTLERMIPIDSRWQDAFMETSPA